MCHPGETDFMPVDSTWGILDPSGIVLSVVSRRKFFFNFLMTALSVFLLLLFSATTSTS